VRDAERERERQEVSKRNTPAFSYAHTQTHKFEPIDPILHRPYFPSSRPRHIHTHTHTHTHTHADTLSLSFSPSLCLNLYLYVFIHICGSFRPFLSFSVFLSPSLPLSHGTHDEALVGEASHGVAHILCHARASLCLCLRLCACACAAAAASASASATPPLSHFSRKHCGPNPSISQLSACV
jgi:hypothetical protein